MATWWESVDDKTLRLTFQQVKERRDQAQAEYDRILAELKRRMHERLGRCRECGGRDGEHESRCQVDD